MLNKKLIQLFRWFHEFYHVNHRLWKMWEFVMFEALLVSNQASYILDPRHKILTGIFWNVLELLENYRTFWKVLDLLENGKVPELSTQFPRTFQNDSRGRHANYCKLIYKIRNDWFAWLIYCGSTYRYICIYT